MITSVSASPPVDSAVGQVDHEADRVVVRLEFEGKALLAERLKRGFEFCQTDERQGRSIVLRRTVDKLFDAPVVQGFEDSCDCFLELVEEHDDILSASRSPEEFLVLY